MNHNISSLARSQSIILFTALLSAALLLSACNNTGNTALPPESMVTETLAVPDEIPEPLQPVEIDGVLFNAETPRLILAGLNVDKKEIEEFLPRFPLLSVLDLRDSSISPEDALSIYYCNPDLSVIWDISLLGNVYSSNTTELDLSGIAINDSSELEESLCFFPKLEKVIMSDCGLSDEYMDSLNRCYDDISFVWTVHFSVYSLRTDATMFCASDIPKLGNVAPELTSPELDPIKYCTDLEALDLGHMNFKDIKFLKNMTKMKYLILVQGKFSDISVIANMPELEYLELFNNNRIIDLTPLLNCKNLKHLNIGYCYYADWAPLKEMPWLERLWMPHVEISQRELEELQEALPDTLIYAPHDDHMGSTGGGWREDESYYTMRDIMEMPYLPGGTGMGLGW